MVTVSNSSQLSAALRNAAPGAVIELTSGNYSLNQGGDAHGATITAAAGANVTFGSVNLRNAHNLTFDGVKFALPSATKGIVVADSSDITIRNSDISGSTAQGTKGIFANHVDGFHLEGNHMSGFATTMAISNISDFTLTDNDIEGMSWDALLAGNINGGLIDGNDVDMAIPAGRKHTDAFQFYNNSGGSGIHDLTISNNYIETHGSSHGIYLTNNVAEASHNVRDFFDGLVIDHNTLLVGNSLGISVGHSDGVQITDNTLLRDPKLGSGSTPIIRVQQESINAEITGNVTHKAPASSGNNWYPNKTLNEPTWHVADNQIVKLGTMPGPDAEQRHFGGSAAPASFDAAEDAFHFNFIDHHAFG